MNTITCYHKVYLSRLQVVNDAIETASCKWVFVVMELFNSAVNDFDTKKSARYSWVLVVTELVASETESTDLFRVSCSSRRPPSTAPCTWSRTRTAARSVALSAGVSASDL